MCKMLRCVWRPTSLCFIGRSNFSSLACNLLRPSRSSLLSAQRPRLSSGYGIQSRVNCRVVSTNLAMSMSTSIGSSLPATEEVGQVKLLSSVNDDYGGVIAELKEPFEPTAFLSVLRASISHWREQGKKGVWIKVPIESINLVEIAVKEGFWFHHAEPNYLMLVCWIPQSPHTIPSNATHRVGIGAVVLNDKNELLVVQEKSGKFQGTGVWKFPTGVVDEGEDICIAAVREVKEETGIDAEFVEVLAFRQSHQSFFQKSDLFFVCMLQPLSHDIKLQDVEIEAARWIPFEEYAAQPFNQKHELLKYIIDMCSAKKEGRYLGFTPVPTTSTFSTVKSFLYLNNHSLKQDQ